VFAYASASLAALVSGFVPSAFFPVNGGGGLPVPELDAPAYTAPSAGDYVIGGYHNFDGVDEYIDFGRITSMEVDTGDAWSVCAWAKQPVIETEVIFNIADGLSNGVSFYCDGSNLVVGFRLGGSVYGIRTASTATLSVWNHVAAICDGTDINLYINGSLVSKTVTAGSYPTASATWSAATKVYVGSTGASFHFGGQIAEVAMWSTDQSANLAAIYNSRARHNLMDLATPPDLFYAPLTSYGDDPGSGGSVAEVVANNDGTGVNMETADAVIPPGATITSSLTKQLDIATSVVTTTKVEDVFAETGTGSSFP
jgi:hypothetical protein